MSQTNKILLYQVKNILLIMAGIASATFALKSFLLPNDFLDGGATGISILINSVQGINISLLIIVINIPFIILGITQISRTFAIKTSLAIIGLALALKFIEFPVLTDEKLLIAVFGGFFLGVGIGLAIRGGCVIDGTEVLAIYISKRSSLSVGDVIGIFNVILFCIAAKFLGINTALYSMLTYAAASKTVDFIIHGIEEYTGVTIVSEHADQIKEMITHKLGRGVTVYKAESGYGKKGDVAKDRKIIFSVVTRLEVQSLLVEIYKVDPEAFVIQHTINDTKGGMIKKRPFHN